MKVLGIDPGTLVMGYGVIESEDDETALIDFGALTPPEHSPIGERLSHLYKGLVEIIQHHQPEAVAVEVVAGTSALPDIIIGIRKGTTWPRISPPGLAGVWMFT